MAGSMKNDGNGIGSSIGVSASLASQRETLAEEMKKNEAYKHDKQLYKENESRDGCLASALCEGIFNAGLVMAHRGEEGD